MGTNLDEQFPSHSLSAEADKQCQVTVIMADRLTIYPKIFRLRPNPSNQRTDLGILSLYPSGGFGSYDPPSADWQFRFTFYGETSLPEQSVSFSKSLREKFLLPADRIRIAPAPFLALPGIGGILFRRTPAGADPLPEDSFTLPSERAACYRSLGLTNV